jgi:hypothetical protein
MYVLLMVLALPALPALALEQALNTGKSFLMVLFIMSD